MYMDKSANRLKELVNNGDIDGMRKALNTNNINEDELQQIISNTFITRHRNGPRMFG